MPFFNKDKKGSELRLVDYENIWTKFCFLDESGTVDNPTTPLFTIGFIKCSEPYYLASKIGYERNKQNFHDELKFNKLSARNIGFAKFAVDAFFSTRSLSFYSYTVDKEGDYFKKAYPTDPWLAYEDISLRVVEAAAADNEILIVIADHVTAPKHVRYEVNLKKKINTKSKRLAIAGVCRINSKANDLLQLTDLIVGAINYDLKIETGLTTSTDKHKLELLNDLKEKFGTKNFLNGFKNYNANIFVDKEILTRLPLGGTDGPPN